MRCTNAFFPNTKIETKGGGRALRNYDILGIDTEGYFRNSTVLGSITVRRSIRGQWSALEREEKIKFWADDRNNSRPGAYEVGVEHGIVDQAPHVDRTRLSMAALLPRLLRKRGAYSRTGAAGAQAAPADRGNQRRCAPGRHSKA